MKKRFGQNFLKNKDLIKKIIDTSNINNDSIVYEVGPGDGSLTQEIIKKNPKRFLAIEIDNDLKNILKKYFTQKNHTLLIFDALKFNELSFFNDNSKDVIILGNLPYNISIKLLIKWIYQYASNKWFKTMILMFQKEVAERITSEENSKQFGRISILASAFFSIKKIDEINKNNFFPSPKVDSVLLQFNALEKPHLTINDLPKLENLTKIFFSNRRKKIKKKIKYYFSEDLICKHNLEKFFELRAENLSKEVFYFLTKLN